MHPALERLKEQAAVASYQDSAPYKTQSAQYADTVAINLARNALPALIAALVEIEALVDSELEELKGFSGRRSTVMETFKAILSRHLEPLK